MIRDFKSSDASWVRSRLSKDIPLDQLKETFRDSNAVSFYKDDAPKLFICLRYSNRLEGYYPFHGMSTKVSYLVGDVSKPEDVVPLIYKALTAMGRKIPESLDKPIYATTDPTILALIVPFFGASPDPTNPRLSWVPKLRTVIERSERWRT